MAREHRAIARSIIETAHQAAAQHRTHHLTHVLSLDPLTVEFMDSNLVLSEDDELMMTSWAREYHHKYAVEVGDNALVERRSGHWLLTDFVTDKSPS